jgi:hypothetical protein
VKHVLPDYIRYAHRRLDVSTEGTAETLAAVDEWMLAFEVLWDASPRRWGAAAASMIEAFEQGEDGPLVLHSLAEEVGGEGARRARRLHLPSEPLKLDFVAADVRRHRGRDRRPGRRMVYDLPSRGAPRSGARRVAHGIPPAACRCRGQRPRLAASRLGARSGVRAAVGHRHREPADRPARGGAGQGPLQRTSTSRARPRPRPRPCCGPVRTVGGSGLTNSGMPASSCPRSGPGSSRCATSTAAEPPATHRRQPSGQQSHCAPEMGNTVPDIRSTARS